MLNDRAKPTQLTTTAPRHDPIVTRREMESIIIIPTAGLIQAEGSPAHRSEVVRYTQSPKLATSVT